MKFTEIARRRFEQAGWYVGRNISSETVYSKEKNVFPAAREIMEEFGYLEVDYIGRDGPTKLYFDIDESEASKILRRKMFAVDSCADAYKHDPNLEFEDLEETAFVESQAGEKCCRLLFFDNEDFPCDIYLTENGCIWVGPNNAHGKKETFYEYINREILG